VSAAFAAVTYRPGAAADPGTLELLTRVERATLGPYRAAERAAAILAAKQAVQRVLPGTTLDQIEVLRRQHSAPRLRVRGIAVPLAVSLSHGDGLAVAAVLGPGVPPCAR
jgi:phosphopantetheinyl transferase (holo-ACP synthase)